jgi:hypothetical protein
MMGIRKTIGMTMIAGIAIAACGGSALAACTAAQMNGAWHFFAMQGKTPGIKNPVTQVVKDGSGVNTNIKVFKPTGMLFENGTATAIACQLTVTDASASGANFTGTCRADAVVAGNGGTGLPVTGNVTLSACTVTGGAIDTGDPTPASFLAGHFFYPSGMGTARQGQSQVFLWNMIKN